MAAPSRSQFQAPARSGPTVLGRSTNGFSGFNTGSTGFAAGRVQNKTLEGYGVGRVHNIPGGYHRKVPQTQGNYSWGGHVI